MKKIFLLQILCLLFQASFACDGVRVSVLTCSPGDEAYSLFGHTAVRCTDERHGVDVVFNYGYFDFDTPGFMWKFILGETDYCVGCVPYSYFLGEYAQRGSSVVEQVLNLTPEQEREIFSLLEDNCRVANRVYRYNYFYNNCTTKVRDKLLEVLGVDKLQLNADSQQATFREALGKLTAEHPWFSFGIDLLLGSEIDEPATPHQLQFIPMNFSTDLDMACIRSGDSVARPLVIERNVLLEENRPVQQKNHLTPFNSSLLLLVFTFIIMLCELRSGKSYWGYDLMIMLLQGAAGLLLLFMALFSEHPAVGSNYLILLLNPLALVLMPIFVYSIIKKKSMNIAWVQVVFVALFLLSAIAGMQVYPAPVYFCAAAILFRSLFNIYKKNICELNIF